jgi:hypothetical protein
MQVASKVSSWTFAVKLPNHPVQAIHSSTPPFIVVGLMLHSVSNLGEPPEAKTGPQTLNRHPKVPTSQNPSSCYQPGPFGR